MLIDWLKEQQNISMVLLHSFMSNREIMYDLDVIDNNNNEKVSHTTTNFDELKECEKYCKANKIPYRYFSPGIIFVQ